MRTRIICDCCRQVFAMDTTFEQEAEQVDELVTLNGLCPDCSGALDKVENRSPS